MASPTPGQFIEMAQALEGQSFDVIALKLQALYHQGRTDALADLKAVLWAR